MNRLSDVPDPVLELVDRALRMPESSREQFVRLAACAATVRAEALGILAAITTDPAAVISESPDRAPTLVGVSLGDFRPVRAIGCGAGGVVYEAEQRFPERRVAIKVLRPGLDPAETLARWRDESTAVGRLQHPSVAAVYAAGVAELDGASPVAWIAMELVDGAMPWTECAGTGLGLDRIIRLGAEFADALGAAHRVGIVHRDVKPSNLLVSGTGVPRVIDFGLAQPVERSTLPAGTRGYVAPECMAGGPATPASDVWSLGTTMAEALRNCRVPRRHPAWRVVDVATDPEPHRRYADGAQMAADLRALVHGGRVRALGSAPVQRLALWARRHPRTSMAVAVSLLAAAASAMWSVVAQGVNDALMLRDAQRILSMHGEFTEALDSVADEDRPAAVERAWNRGLTASSAVASDAEVAFLSAAALIRLDDVDRACELADRASAELRAGGVPASDLAWIELLSRACAVRSSPGDGRSTSRLVDSMVQLSRASRGSDLVLGCYVYAVTLQSPGSGFSGIVPMLLDVPDLHPARSITGTSVLVTSAALPDCDWSAPARAETALDGVDRWTRPPLDAYLAPMFADMATDALQATMSLGDVPRLDALASIARLASSRVGNVRTRLVAEASIAISELRHGLLDRSRSTMDRMLSITSADSAPAEYWAFWLPTRLKLACREPDAPTAIRAVIDAAMRCPWVLRAQPSLSRAVEAWMAGRRADCELALRDWRERDAAVADDAAQRSDAALCDWLLSTMHR